LIIWVGATHDCSSASQNFRACISFKMRKGKEKEQKGNEKNTQKILSKTICQILRHTAKDEGLDMRPDGYVLLKDLMQVPAVKKLNPTEKDIEKVVEENDKQRFSLLEEGRKTWIRANQGQSLQGIDMDQLCEPVQELRPGEVCCHGTLEKHLESILSKGLLAGGHKGQKHRRDVHFSIRHPGEAVLSGMRTDCQIAVYVDLPKAVRSGIPFHRSTNDVILSEGVDGIVPPEFIESIWHIKRKQQLYPAERGDSGNATNVADATDVALVLPTVDDVAIGNAATCVESDELANAISMYTTYRTLLLRYTN